MGEDKSSDLPQSVNGVIIECSVSPNNRDVLNHCLGNYQAIKRIAMMKRKVYEFCQMGYLYFQKLDPIQRHLVRDQTIKWSSQGQFTDTHFNCHFSNTGHAQKPLIGRIFDKVTRILTQVGMSTDEP